MHVFEVRYYNGKKTQDLFWLGFFVWVFKIHFVSVRIS